MSTNYYFKVTIAHDVLFLTFIRDNNKIWMLID